MKKLTLSLFIIFCSFSLFAQKSWFYVYSDSIALVNDANKIVVDMTNQINKIKPDLNFKLNNAIKNTSPYLIYVNSDKGIVNLPLWSEVIPPQKKFFADVAGNEKDGLEVFGLFFNGFYLTHEVGHSFYHSMGKSFNNRYDSEYDANVIGMLYWRQKNKAELKLCYKYAKKMLEKLTSPIPPNENYKEYMAKHFNELSSDPYKYGYIQFKQFVEIYEDKSLPDFNTYIKNYK